MNTANEAAHPFNLIKVVDFELSAAYRRKYRKAESASLLHSFAIDGKRGYQRNIGTGQLQSKGVFFEDLLICPATGTVKFDHQALTVFGFKLIYAVFVTVQRQ